MQYTHPTFAGDSLRKDADYPKAPSVAGNYHHHFTNGFVYITVDECHRINIVCSSHFKPCEQVLYETAYKGYGNYLARECATAQQTGLPEQEGLVLQGQGLNSLISPMN